MRRPFFLGLAVALYAAALAACGGAEEAVPALETPGATPAAGTVSIDFWHSETAANLEALERLVARFNASQDEVRVQPAFQGSGEDAVVKLLASLRSDQAPAIALLAQVDTRRIIDSGAVTPLQDFMDQEGYDLSDLDERAVRSYAEQDRLWGMPFSVIVPLLWYNKVIFREVGLDHEVTPRDLEELRRYSEKILKRDASGQLVRSGIAIDILFWLEYALAEHGELFVDRDNGREGRATKVLFYNDTGRWFFQWWHDMIDEGLALNVGRNPTAVEGALAMATGRAAMTFGASNALRSVVNALEAAGAAAEGIEIGVGRLPGVPGGTGASLLQSSGLWVFRQRSEQEQEAAWKFIKWLIEPEQQAEWFAGSGYLPVSRSSLDLPAAREVVARYPLFRVALDLYLNAPATPATLGALLGPHRQVQEFVIQAVEQMLAGAKDPLPALEEAAARSNQAITEYNQRVGD